MNMGPSQGMVLFFSSYLFCHWVILVAPNVLKTDRNSSSKVVTSPWYETQAFLLMGESIMPHIFVKLLSFCLSRATPAAQALHCVLTSLWLQIKQKHWIPSKAGLGSRRMSPCPLPIPLAPLLSRAPQSSKENLPKVGIVSMYPFKGHLDMCSTTIWVVRENMPLHNDTKSSFVKKNLYGSNFVQPKFSCKPTFIVAVKAPSRTRHMGHVLFRRRISLLAPYLTSY